MAQAHASTQKRKGSPPSAAPSGDIPLSKHLVEKLLTKFADENAPAAAPRTVVEVVRVKDSDDNSSWGCLTWCCSTGVNCVGFCIKGFALVGICVGFIVFVMRVRAS